MTWFYDYGKRLLITGKTLNAGICRLVQTMTPSLQKMMTVSRKPSIFVTVNLTTTHAPLDMNALYSHLRTMRNMESGAGRMKLREKR